MKNRVAINWHPLYHKYIYYSVFFFFFNICDWPWLVCWESITSPKILRLRLRYKYEINIKLLSLIFSFNEIFKSHCKHLPHSQLYFPNIEKETDPQQASPTPIWQKIKPSCLVKELLPFQLHFSNNQIIQLSIEFCIPL